MNHDRSQHYAALKPFWNSRYLIGLFILGAVPAYLLPSERAATFFGALSILLLLGCPLMHVRNQDEAPGGSSPASRDIGEATIRARRPYSYGEDLP